MTDRKPDHEYMATIDGRECKLDGARAHAAAWSLRLTIDGEHVGQVWLHRTDEPFSAFAGDVLAAKVAESS